VIIEKRLGSGSFKWGNLSFTWNNGPEMPRLNRVGAKGTIRNGEVKCPSKEKKKKGAVAVRKSQGERRGEEKGDSWGKKYTSSVFV